MPSRSEKPQYRKVRGETLIEFRLHSVGQMFHTLDPSPFDEKDLDEDAAGYLLEACGEAGGGAMRLAVNLPESQAQSDAARTLPDAINHYFAYRERQRRKEVARLLRYGAVSLLIGLVFLMACIALRRELMAGGYIEDQSIVDQGLLILGWVAMWRPIEVLLYDWWPLSRRGIVLRRLTAIPVEIRAA
jgi:hypothetical protein